MEAKRLKRMIEVIMDEKEWTQSELADYVGVTQAQVSRWLSGIQSPNAEATMMIYELYNKLDVKAS